MIEILSPATARRDRGVKLRLYGQHVAQFWVVDPDDDAVEVWRFAGDPQHERFTERLPVRLGDEILGEIDLVEIFARQPRPTLTTSRYDIP